MSNKKNRPDVLDDGFYTVGGKGDGRKVIETPQGVVKNPNSVPGVDNASHAFLKGAGKRRFDRSEK
jgi:hypothetical protein